MDYKELKADNERLKAEIDSYHLWYEDFNKFDLAISNGNGVLASMYSNVLQAKKKQPDNVKVTEQEQMINELFGIFEMMQGLNNKAQSLKLRFKHLQTELSSVSQELEAMKKAFEND